MPGAYGNALVFVFPSRFEGFGLPALEAMACGAPFVLADATSLPEVGGDATMYFPVGDSEALSSVLLTLLNDVVLRRDLSQRGLNRAASFTWEATATATADVYRKALAS